MQPINFDAVMRAIGSDSFSLYTSPDAPPPLIGGTFGSHLQDLGPPQSGPMPPPSDTSHVLQTATLSSSYAERTRDSDSSVSNQNRAPLAQERRSSQTDERINEPRSPPESSADGDSTDGTRDRDSVSTPPTDGPMKSARKTRPNASKPSHGDDSANPVEPDSSEPTGAARAGKKVAKRDRSASVSTKRAGKSDPDHESAAADEAAVTGFAGGTPSQPEVDALRESSETRGPQVQEPPIAEKTVEESAGSGPPSDGESKSSLVVAEIQTDGSATDLTAQAAAATAKPEPNRLDPQRRAVGRESSTPEASAGLRLESIGVSGSGESLSQLQTNEALEAPSSARSTAAQDPGAHGANSPDASLPGPASPSLRFAQHLAARPGERLAKTSPVTEVEQARLVERVARAFRAAEDQGGTITLRLHPPELGVLRVELRVQDGALSARLEAETPAARAVLLDNSHLLRDRLAEQGVRVERFDVDLLDRRSTGDSSTFGQSQPREQSPSQHPQPQERHPTSGEPETLPARPTTSAPGQLNVIV